MHWSVGMLLHAVCVFFYKGGKKKEKRHLGKLTSVVFSQHISLSAWCCWSGLHSIQVSFWFYVLHILSALMQSRCLGTDSSVLAFLCHDLAFATPNRFFPLEPLGYWFLSDKMSVFLWPYLSYRIISRSGFYCLLFLEPPIELNYLF